MENKENKEYMKVGKQILIVNDVSKSLVWYTRLLAGLIDISPGELIVNALEKIVIENAFLLENAHKGNEIAYKEFQNYIANLKQKHKQYQQFLKTLSIF